MLAVKIQINAYTISTQNVGASVKQEKIVIIVELSSLRLENKYYVSLSFGT